MNNIIKTTFTLLLSAIFITACNDGANDFGRVDQKNDNIPAPSPVSVESVRSISGGAVIKVNIPDDDNVKGVIARYTRNGKQVNSKISRYVDSLTVVGFVDTKPHTVEIAAINVNEVESTPVKVEISPLEPAISLAKATLYQTFGGVKVRIDGNTPKENLTIVLLRDTDLSDFEKPTSQMKWEQVTTLFTAAETITLPRRGIEPVEAIFGAYLRDRWGNVSDTVKAILTPLEEVELDKDKFRDAKIKDDNCTASATKYKIENLWDKLNDDGKGNYIFDSKQLDLPTWLTIDLGVKTKLSHIKTLPRGQGYLTYTAAHPRIFEFWGSANPTGEKVEGNTHGFDNSWFLLGRFEQAKPSGYDPDGSPGVITQDDNAYWNAGNDFEFNNEEYPHAYDELRYLRVVFIDSFGTYGFDTKSSKIQMGELTPFGQVLQEYR